MTGQPGQRSGTVSEIGGGRPGLPVLVWFLWTESTDHAAEKTEVAVRQGRDYSM